jgi:hypothetical protein
MRQLASDLELRLQMGKTARRRVEQTYTWDEIGRSLVQLYEDAVAQSTSSLQPPQPRSIESSNGKLQSTQAD